MCLDFPGQVVECAADRVRVDCAGRSLWASTLLYPDLVVGDWVHVAAGTVIERLDSAAAREINHDIAIARGMTR
jgi:hydrogenase assembly chaperone HypC/HupF